MEDPIVGSNVPGLYGRVLCLRKRSLSLHSTQQANTLVRQLAPMAGIIASDYWLIKRRRIDVPALYDPYGRYRYWNGINLPGLIAFIVAVAPNLPGLAYSINPTGTYVSPGIVDFYSIDWLYGFVSSIVVYTTLHKIFPARESLIPKTIDGVEIMEERKARTDSPDGAEEEKHIGKFDDGGHGHAHGHDHGKGEGPGFANVDPLHHAPDVRE